MNASLEAPTYSGPVRPFFVRFLNATGGGLRKIGLRHPRLDVDSLLSATKLEARLDGPGDEAFLSRFRALLEDAEGPARLTFVGRIAARIQMTNLIRQRLLVRRCLAATPEIEQVPLGRPLFVVGQARTGTTLLYNLLAQDPAARSPRLWELQRPVPPPDPATYDSDPRIREVETEINRVLSVIPAVMSAHTVDPRAPEECYHLLEYAAFSSTFLLYFDIPSYWRRLMSAPPDEARVAYGEFRRQVQLLQYRVRGGHWLSKSPAHLFFLDALLEAFPDARVVRTHRDPLESIPSLCSLIAIVRSLSSDHIDAKAIGAASLGWYLEASRRAEAARASAGDRIFDISYRRLMADPAGAVKEIYDRLGYAFTPEFAERIRAWTAANPQHKHGVHRYSLEQFGLEPFLVERETADYRRKYLG